MIESTRPSDPDTDPQFDDFANSPTHPRDLLLGPQHQLQRLAIETALFGGAAQAVALGRYRLLNRLGHGGMGTVYAAFDDHLDRKIAIKLIHPKLFDKGEIHERTLREARALARLSHPNVVHVYEVGELEGQLFVAMEFLAGPTLRDWLEDGQKRSWQEILAVLQQAGQGLAAAHAEGIIHRDFKPHNVMFGAEGRVRVLDFGLARMDDTELEPDTLEPEPAASVADLPHGQLTRTGTLIGTPAYMAPEQLERRRADARSDQFSFCVTLHEALYRDRPFQGRTLAQLLDGIRRAVPVEPPRDSSVPAWLRKVVLRGLAPEPEHRFESMQALLDALADDPALRRRKWWMGVGLVGLLGGTVWGLAQTGETRARVCAGMDEELAGVWDDDRRAQVKTAFEATKLGYASSTWLRVESGLDQYTREWVAMRTRVCEASQRGEQSGELLDLRMACLDERLLHVRETVTLLAAADEAILEKAVEMVAGLPMLESCDDVEALSAEVPPPPDAELARRVSTLDEQLIEADVLLRAGKYEKGLEIADAVVDEAEQLDYLPLRVRAWRHQGELLRKLAKFDAAETSLARAFDAALALRMFADAASVSARLTCVTGSDLERHEDGRRWARVAEPLSRAAGTSAATVQYLECITATATAEGNYEESLGYAEHALAIQETSLGAEHIDVASALHNLGIVLNDKGEYPGARSHLERALAIKERVLGPDHPELVNTLSSLGVAAVYSGDYPAARSFFERALAVAEQGLGPTHLLVAQVLANLGALAGMEGHYEQSRDYLERALPIRIEQLGAQHPKVGEDLNNLGLVAYYLGDYEVAISYLERACAIHEAALGPQHPTVGNCYGNRGNVAREQRKFDEARAFLQRMRTIHEQTFGARHIHVADIIHNLGSVDLDDGKPAEAQRQFEEALEIYLEGGLGADHPDVAMAHHSIGEAARLQGEYQVAREHYELALSARERTMGPEHPSLGEVLTGMGRVSLALHDPAEALGYLERALSIRASSNEVRPLDLAQTREELARALWDAPVAAGRDRARARELATLARDAYREAGELGEQELARTDAWLASHELR